MDKLANRLRKKFLKRARSMRKPARKAVNKAGRWLWMGSVLGVAIIVSQEGVVCA